MVHTRVQLEVEDWVRREWLPREFGQKFSRERLKLTSGGVFDFDAVSGDGKIVASISTSAARTARGKLGVGKLAKIRADMLFLLMASCDRRLLVLTDITMLEQCQKERAAGRVPPLIEFMHAKIPPELEGRLVSSREAASREVTPENDP
jgi:hypothetical protein